MKIEKVEDKETVERIKAVLEENGGYCPCATIHTQDTKCMCKSFRDQEEEGQCHCGLYTKTKD